MPAATASARATAQLLHRPPGEPVAIVRHLLGVQAQDPRQYPLALRARGTGFGASDVRAALERGELVVAWLMRGTLHLVAAEDHGWLLALTAPHAPAGRFPVTDRDVTAVQELLPTTRERLTERFGERAYHVLARAAREGVCVLGPDRRVVAAPPPGPGGDLGARYLAAHARAAPEDLAAWAGIGIRAARAALADREPEPPAAQPLPPRLLPMFDEYVLGWREHRLPVRGGMIPAVAVTGGVIETTWSRAKPPPPAYAEELADIDRFLSA